MGIGDRWRANIPWISAHHFESHPSAGEVASLLNKTTRTIERHLKALREQGRIQRVGSDKVGDWQMLDSI
jgi:DNA-binding transcriptional ArsR family regulator